MEWFQKEIILTEKKRGFHLITDEVLLNISEISKIKIGVAHIFIKHTSASISINENADPTVRQDMESFFNKLIPENAPFYRHNYEGADDMPAHIKSSLFGSSVTIPITAGRFNMGTWQGIYLCEHRNHGGKRKLLITILGKE